MFDREFESLANAGVEVLRWWVLAGGVNYPVGERIEAVGQLPTAPRNELFRLVPGRDRAQTSAAQRSTKRSRSLLRVLSSSPRSSAAIARVAPDRLRELGKKTRTTRSAHAAFIIELRVLSARHF